jgi:serine/threonine-protein kinase HipA
MRKAKVLVSNLEAGILTEMDNSRFYCFEYLQGYLGNPISLTMPVRAEAYKFDGFPPFFDGLLPEGPQLEGLLKNRRIDRYDFFSQLLAVGTDMVGNLTVKEIS